MRNITTTTAAPVTTATIPAALAERIRSAHIKAKKAESVGALSATRRGLAAMRAAAGLEAAQKEYDEAFSAEGFNASRAEAAQARLDAAKKAAAGTRKEASKAVEEAERMLRTIDERAEVVRVAAQRRHLVAALGVKISPKSLKRLAAK